MTRAALRAAALLARRAIVLGLAAGMASMPVAAEDAPAPVEGERGHLLTTLRGTEVERVPVRYVGVLRGGIGPGIDLHLIEVEGDVGESVGVASGMSGSPVYFDGRPFGALSYRLGAMPRRAIGGVTRLVDMERADRSTSPPSVDSVEPIATPVHLGGLPAAVRAWLAPRLAEHGLDATAGGAAGGKRVDAEPLRPGAPVGVELVRGDVGIAATGTVTTVDDGRVLAFGHPFLGVGRIEAPLVTADVVHTLSDGLGSVKLANTGAAIGAVLDDRLTAIVGRLGAEAAMLPVRVRCVDADGAERVQTSEVVRNSPLTALLVGATVATGALGSIEAESRATVRATGVVEMDGLPDIPIDVAFAGNGGGSPTFRVAAEVQRILGHLVGGPLGDAPPRAVRLDLEIVDRPIAYRLRELLYDRGPVPAGGRIDVTAILAAHGGAIVRETLSVPVPSGLAPGTRIALAVGSPRDVDAVSGRTEAARVRSATDLRSLVEALGSGRGDHRLTAAWFRLDRGLVTEGELYTDLPPTARGLVVSDAARRDVRSVAVAPISRVERPLDGPVTGGLSAAFVVGPGIEDPGRTR